MPSRWDGWPLTLLPLRQWTASDSDQPDAKVRLSSAMQGLLAVSNVPIAVVRFEGRLIVDDDWQ